MDQGVRLEHGNMQALDSNPWLRYTEASVPNPNPAALGSALAVAKAYNAFVLAVHEFNLLRRSTGPISMELRAKQVGCSSPLSAL